MLSTTCHDLPSSAVPRQQEGGPLEIAAAGLVNAARRGQTAAVRRILQKTTNSAANRRGEDADVVGAGGSEASTFSSNRYASRALKL